MNEAESRPELPTRAASPRRLDPRHIAFVIGIIALHALTLLLMGRTPICRCGTVRLWEGVVASPENSQQLADWYSPSHVIHGFIFYGVTWLLARRRPFGWRLIAATLVEATWEIVENSDFIINRYREATISLDYYGDSVINSVSDVSFMILGFFLASRLPVWGTIAIALFFEAFTGFMIRDNLALNVLMLLWPVAAIRTWQSGA
jgi:Protein of unknown function (DUF2585)